MNPPITNIPNGKGFGDWLNDFYARCQHFIVTRFFHEWQHWLRVVLLIILGEFLPTLFESNELYLYFRHRAYQWTLNSGPRPVRPRYTAAVLIDDEPFWKTTAGRVPINRVLVASLVDAIAAHKPDIIALDFDLSTGDEDVATTVNVANKKIRLREHQPYARETVALCESLMKALAADIIVILPEEVMKDEDRHWIKAANVYEGFDFRDNDVRKGHILLDSDIRKIPAPLRLKKGEVLKSVSIAAAEARYGDVLPDLDLDHDVFAGFVNADDIPRITASELLRANKEVRDKKRQKQINRVLRSKVVLIGEAWHRSGNGRGRQLVDSHRTPVGEMPGVLVHANYIEALLDARLLTMGHNTAIEVPLILAAALLLSLQRNDWMKLLAICGTNGVLILLCFVLAHDFGIYFETLLVVLLLSAHAVAETIFEWYKDHRTLERVIAEGLAQRPS
jgi:CHASE2 domain-containing sensor protein